MGTRESTETWNLEPTELDTLRTWNLEPPGKLASTGLLEARRNLELCKNAKAEQKNANHRSHTQKWSNLHSKMSGDVPLWAELGTWNLLEPPNSYKSRNLEPPIPCESG